MDASLPCIGDAESTGSLMTASSSLRLPFKGAVLACGAALLWGVSGTVGQFLFDHRGMTADWLVAVRMLISGLILLALSMTRFDIFAVWRNRADAIRIAVFAIFGMLLVQYTYFAAIAASNAATATVLQYIGPALIAAWYTWRERRLPTVFEALSVALAIGGTLLLVTHGKLNSLAISPLAVVLGLSSAVALAIYTIQPVALMDRYASPVIIGWGMLIGGLALSFVRAPWEVPGTWDGATWAGVAFIIVFGTLIPFHAFLSAVRLVGPRTASLLACAEPLSAAIIAVMWLGTRFVAADWIGTACILATIVLLTLKQKLQVAVVSATS